MSPGSGSAMQSETARMASFKKAKKYSRRSSIQGSREWPHPTNGDFLAYPESLAEAGFYHDPYALYPDNVTCFLCKEEYAEWEEDDDPHEIHIKISPKCPWALVRCALELDKDDKGNFDFRTKSRIPTSRVLEKARIGSFGDKEAKWWPHDSDRHGCNIKKMAKAGFVFTPDITGDDTATCMYCDTTLSGWEVDDDPLIEHSRRPAGQACAFILALNRIVRPVPKPRATKARKITRETTREEKAKETEKECKPSDSDYDSQRVAKKISKPKPKKDASPAKTKKPARPALTGLDVNVPGLNQSSVVIKPTTGRLQEVFGNYQTIKKLGSGTFGEVYLGVDLASNRQVAIKLESVKAQVPMLKLESQMYAKLRGSAGVPVIKWFGTVRDCNVLVLPVLGRSLSSVLHACGGRFSLPTVLMLADQLISRLQALHGNGMIHRDLKPDNFLIGRELWDKTIYVIDLGMAKVYRDERGNHIPWKTNKGFWGNPRYASIGAHEGNEQSRRNDMEALAYILIDCLQGDLPWPPVQKSPDGVDDYGPIGRAKRNTHIEVLCAGMPPEFAMFLKHARSLAFEAKPDYEGMRYMFQKLAWRLGYGPDMEYDWFGR